MQNTHQTLRQISRSDFLAFGLNDLAYVRAVSGPEGEIFGIFAADGRQMALAASRDLAFAAIRQNGMEPLSLH